MNSLLRKFISIVIKRIDFCIQIYEEGVQAAEGVIPFLDELERQKIPRAVATSEPDHVAAFLLARTRVRPYFQAVVSGSDVRQQKPHPEIYLAAARQLGKDPEYCVAIEDSVSGVQSAKAANMKVIAVTTSFPVEKLARADLIVESFQDMYLRASNGRVQSVIRRAELKKKN